MDLTFAARTNEAAESWFLRPLVAGRVERRPWLMFCSLIVSLLAILLPPAPAAASEEAWRALAAGGTVALMRHARAPGTGDPTDFRLEDCATQRNLSDEGRVQARRIGEAFGQRRIAVAGVLSSRWCRSLDTARLAFGDAVRPFPPLDSFFAGRGSSEAQTRDVRREIASWRGRQGVLVMVTHQVNITALTGIFPQEGEVIVLAPESSGEPRVVGSVRP